jgi:hypothetical protein
MRHLEIVQHLLRERQPALRESESSAGLLSGEECAGGREETGEENISKKEINRPGETMTEIFFFLPTLCHTECHQN